MGKNIESLDSYMELLEKLEEESRRTGVETFNDLSDELKKDLETAVPPEFISRGIDHIVFYLESMTQ